MISVAEVAAACHEAETWTRERLLALAIGRGCDHYAPLWPDLPAAGGVLPHEVLGCALLRGPTGGETFQAIRCGAMVLSDLSNAPASIAAAAARLGVAGRVVHIARLALTAADYPEFWRNILAGLPDVEPNEPEFLPGLSRFASETRLSGPRSGPVRLWLRTQSRTGPFSAGTFRLEIVCKYAMGIA